MNKTIKLAIAELKSNDQIIGHLIYTLIITIIAIVTTLFFWANIS